MEGWGEAREKRRRGTDRAGRRGTHDAEAKMPTHEEMMAAKLDINVRDNCAHLLIPLNKCRIATHFAMWKCDHERHEYEKCQ